MGFNTAIAALMEAVNELYKLKAEQPISKNDSWKDGLETLVQLLAPFAPHISEELWQEMGHTTSVHLSAWPKWDAKLVKKELLTIAVQVNGKVRSEIMLAPGATEEQAVKAAKADGKVASQIEGKSVKRAIYVPGRLVSLVVE